MIIEHYEDIPKDALDAIAKEVDDMDNLTTVSDFIWLIQEWGDYEEEVDSCYITNTYTAFFGDWKLITWGSSYRKDQSVCDEEMSDNFELISLEEEKKEKQKAKNAKRAKSDENWRTLFSSIDGSVTPEKAFEMMKDYKFPTKWKK